MSTSTSFHRYGYHHCRHGRLAPPPLPLASTTSHSINSKCSTVSLPNCPTTCVFLYFSNNLLTIFFYLQTTPDPRPPSTPPLSIIHLCPSTCQTQPRPTDRKRAQPPMYGVWAPGKFFFLFFFFLLNYFDFIFRYKSLVTMGPYYPTLPHRCEPLLAGWWMAG